MFFKLCILVIALVAVVCANPEPEPGYAGYGARSFGYGGIGYGARSFGYGGYGYGARSFGYGGYAGGLGYGRAFYG